MPLVRFSVACLVALTCLGSSHAVAGGPLPGKPSNLVPTLLVELCFGDACGPKAVAGGRVGDIPPIAKQAGTVTASGPLSFRCPGACGGTVDHPVTVTIRAIPRRGAYTEFQEWQGACVGTVPTCTLRVKARMNVRAIFHRYR